MPRSIRHTSTFDLELDGYDDLDLFYFAVSALNQRAISNRLLLSTERPYLPNDLIS